MIIYEDGRYSQSSLYPNELFDSNALYVIPDDTEYAIRYQEIYSWGIIPILLFEDDEIVGVTYDPEDLEKEDKKEATLLKIETLKAELASEDYKIIKCYECSMLGEELPYDLVALVNKRNMIRHEINELEDCQ